MLPEHPILPPRVPSGDSCQRRGDACQGPSPCWPRGVQLTQQLSKMSEPSCPGIPKPPT